jgi:hypothetical protein
MTQPRADRAQPLVPRREIAAPALQGRVPLEEDALVFAQRLAIRGPQCGRLPVDVLPAVAHRAAHDLQAIGGIHRDLQAPVVGTRRDLASIDAQATAGGTHLHLELRAPLRAAAHPTRGQSRRSATDDGRDVIGPERPTASQQRDRFQQRRLALGIAAHEDVQPRIERQPHVPQVPHVGDLHRLHPHSRASRLKAASA